MRIGHGFDAHRFTLGRPLVLGGVVVPFEFGLAAHSDGDVVLHAVCDALLGAAALGDLGRHFPDDAPEYADAESRGLLRSVVSRLRCAAFRVSNVDVTVIAQRPRLAPYVGEMRANLSADLGIGISRVSVKATTTEGMGYTGRVEGIAVHAVALVEEATVPEPER